jgi:putative membrane protein
MADSLPLGLTWAAFWLHFLGERIAARRTGRPRDALARRRALAFYAGLLVIVISIATPIESYSKQLLWTHMIQHVLLLSVAAPLIVLGAPWMSLWRPLPLGIRRTLARAFTRSPRLAPVRWLCRIVSRPVGALIAYSLNLLVWHLPALYDAALRNSSVHALEHITFMGFGILLWAQVIDSPPARPSLGYPGRIALLVAAMIPNIALSMVLAFSRSPIYPYYAEIAHRPGGISGFTDQQVAAGIMWTAGDLPFAIAVVVLAIRWLSGYEAEERRAAELAATSAEGPAPEPEVPVAAGARTGLGLT